MTAPKIIEVSLEEAYEIAERLENKSTHETKTMKVFSGLDCKYGQIHIAIPPLGNPLLLPVVIQNFEL